MEKPPRKRARVDGEKKRKMSKGEREEAERIAAIAARAEARALARAEERKRKDVVRRPKVVFMTKAQRLERQKEKERAKQKLRGEKEKEERKQKEDFLKRSRKTISRTKNKKDRVKEDVKKEIKERAKKRKQKKFRTFVFDWDASEDTSTDTNPLYNKTMRPALAFGRGYVAGIDLREQRKQNKYIEALLDDRQSRELKEEKSLKLSAKERRSRDLSRRKERDSMMRRAKKVDDEVDKQLAIFDSTEHWKNKKLSEMSRRDWRILREDFDIRLRGGKAPNPLRYWEESGICEEIQKALAEMNFKTPSPIQRQAIPIGMEFRDVIGIAETGSGKTAAFVIPMIHYIQQVPRHMRDRTPQDGPLALIMAPTRELAIQIETETKKIARHTSIRVVSIVGGVSIQEQGFKVREGCDIIIATPGRMLDCMSNRYVVLNQCNYIVLDEADRMVDMGFEPQVNEIMNSMATLLKAENEEEMERQIAEKHLTSDSNIVLNYRVTSMYSATMPTEVEKLAKTFLRHPVIVSIGDKESRVNMRIKQDVIFMTESQKKKKILEILRQNRGPFMVFVNIRTNCDVVNRELNRSGYRAVAIHGGKNQEARQRALREFREGKFPILVATDVAGRGIDVPNVKHVVNYDMPNSIEKYTHRIGRTGRAGKSGMSTTFLTEHDEDVMYDLKKHLEFTNQAICRELEKNPKANTRPGEFSGGDKKKKGGGGGKKRGGR